MISNNVLDEHLALLGIPEPKTAIMIFSVCEVRPVLSGNPHP